MSENNGDDKSNESNNNEISYFLAEKKKLVIALAEKMKEYSTILLASTKNLPSSEFHLIKKNLRGTAEVKVAKKSAILRSIEATDNKGLFELKGHVGADVALFFSNEDAFKLSATLADNQTPSKAKAGDISPEDIKVEAGPTELLPGPAISELSGVGLKVAVEDGKLSIKKGATILKAGDEVTEGIASVLGKLNILPMKVGFIPIAAYDAKDNKVYVGIRIDKEATFEELQTAIAKSLSFAVNIGNVNKKTISYFIAKAGLEELALENLVESKSDASAVEEKLTDEEKKDDAPVDASAENTPVESPTADTLSDSPSDNTSDNNSDKEESS